MKADTTVQALQVYLAVRGMGPTDHVFLYRNKPVCKDPIRSRIKAAGDRVGVKVPPRRLRHTCATQLLNAGCRVTSIQKFLGHRRLNSTMIYARAHDKTVANDSYAAMAQVESRLALPIDIPSISPSRHELLVLLDMLRDRILNEAQQEIVQTLRARVLSMIDREARHPCADKRLG